MNGNEWVCKACDRALRQGVMPLQAKINELQLSQTLPVLSDLNAFEVRLICLCVHAIHENGSFAIW